MRSPLPLTLALSAAIHLVVGSCLFFTISFPPRSKPAGPAELNKTTLTLIEPEKVIMPPAKILTSIAPTQLPPPLPKPVVASTLAAPAMKPALDGVLPPPPVKEPNPNAHVREIPTEAVLSPTPPPQLDGTKGVVFILDISGSMYEPYAGSTRLAYARMELARRIRALPDQTPLAIVLYAKRAVASGPLVPANAATREAAVRYLLRDVDCGGGTNLPAGIAAAKALHVGALVVATDGDLNMSEVRLMMEVDALLGTLGQCGSVSILGIAPRPGSPANRLLEDLAEREGGTYQPEQFDSAISLK